MKKNKIITIFSMFVTLSTVFFAQGSTLSREQEIKQYVKMNPDLQDAFDFLHQNNVIKTSLYDFLDKNLSDDTNNEELNYDVLMTQALDMVEGGIKSSCLWSLSTKNRNFIADYVASCKQGFVHDFFKELELLNSIDQLLWIKTENLCALSKIHDDKQFKVFLFFDTSLRVLDMPEFQFSSLYDVMKNEDEKLLIQLKNSTQPQTVTCNICFETAIKSALILKLKEHAVMPIDSTLPVDPCNDPFKAYIYTYKDNQLQQIFKKIIDESLVLSYSFEPESDIYDNQYSLTSVVIAYDAADILKILMSVYAAGNERACAINNNYLLHLAVCFKAPQCVSFLIEAGANITHQNIEATNFTQHNPLFLAKDIEIFNQLILAGADIQEITTIGENLLHHVESDDVFDLLITAGLDVNAVSSQGVTPLFLAVRRKQKNIVEKLLTHGAHANIQDMHWLSFLHEAVVTGQKDVVEMLLAYGADINTQSYGGWTPLHEAIIYRMQTEEYDEYARELDARDQSYRVPLHENEDIEDVNLSYCVVDHKFVGSMIPFLLDHDADCTIKDNDGYTARDLAEGKHDGHGSYQMVALMQQKLSLT